MENVKKGNRIYVEGRLKIKTTPYYEVLEKPGKHIELVAEQIIPV